jgi:hypothetical protein
MKICKRLKNIMNYIIKLLVYRQVPILRPPGVLRLTRRRYHFANLKPGGLRLAQHGTVKCQPKVIFKVPSTEGYIKNFSLASVCKS